MISKLFIAHELIHNIQHKEATLYLYKNNLMNEHCLFWRAVNMYNLAVISSKLRFFSGENAQR